MLLLPVFCFGNVFKERLASAEAGDYIVTEYQEVMSMLRVREIEGLQVTLEEVSVPWHQMRGKSDWKGWLASGAEGHCSWILYTIDLDKNVMVECFSHSRNAYLDTSDSLITELLTLNLKQVPDKERKRVGPPPMKGPDTRGFWAPMKTFEGKKQKPSGAQVWQVKLPKDDTPLSGKVLDLFFDSDIPFPYWIQIHEPGRGHIKVRSIDCGKGSLSPCTFQRKMLQ